MKLVFLLASLVSVSVSYTGCPTLCNCSDTTVSCIEKQIEYVPNFDSLDMMPVIVDLSGNKINYIGSSDFSFDNNYYIKELYLNNSQIAGIEDDAFEELDNLQELYLQQNLLNEVSATIIESLENMLVLDLSNNYFTSGMPVIRSKSLEVLGLANSKITNVPEDVLKHLPNLKMLLMPQNNIKHIMIDVFKHVPQDFLTIKLSYNTWDCGCKNVELFHYLAGKGYIDTSEPYQCLNDSGMYVNIYDKNDVSVALKAKCYNGVETKQLENLVDDKRSIPVIQNDIQKPYSLVKIDNETTIEEDEDNEVSIEDITEDQDGIAEFINEWIGVIVFMCCFLIGFLLGFYVHVLAVNIRIRNLETESSTKLLLA